VPTQEISGKTAGPQRRQRLWIALGAIVAVVVVVAVVLAVLLNRGNDEGSTGANGADGDSTQVTSPYDLHELPAGTGPGDVDRASLVSISLPADNGQPKYYGLSADTEASKALIKAVSRAKEVDAPGVVTTTTAAGSSTSVTAVSTLTFLFPDRSTLVFDLYLKQDVIGRGGQFWKVDGDLEALVQAASKSAGASQ
jgi:hypothetical protein